MEKGFKDMLNHFLLAVIAAGVLILILPSSTVADVPQPIPSPGDAPTIALDESVPRGNWTLDIEESPLYIGLVTDDAIYAYHGNDIYCISPEGKYLWKVTIPGQWDISIYTKMRLSPKTYRYASMTIMCADEGMLYVYAPPSNRTNIIDYSRGTLANVTGGKEGWDVVAIGPDGNVKWAVPLDTAVQQFDDTSLQVKNGIVYAFHSNNETVIASNGTVLFTVKGISDPCAIDEDGNLYVTPAGPGNEPVNVIESYAPDGMLRWRKILDENVVRQYMVEDAKLKYNTLPLHQDGSLYIPIRRGIIVLDTDGNGRWARQFNNGFYMMFEVMPVDSDGNVYLVDCGNQDSIPTGQESFIYMISPDGKEVSPPRSYRANHGLFLGYAGEDGIIYTSERIVGDYTNYSLDDLATFTVSAYDLKNGTYLWNYTLPTTDRHAITLTRNDVEGIFGPHAETLDDPDSSEVTTPPGSLPSVGIWPSLNIYPAGDRVYVEFHSASYEMPIVFGRSKCIFTSSVFVIDSSGNVLSRQQLSTVVTSMALNNGTAYYSTGDGRISTALIGVASGTVILAAAFLFLKFIGFGHIARARSRIDRNDNRNMVMKFIAANPGCTQYEIARGLGLNLGTVRYHLMILGINHRMATYRDDTRRVRYFTNAGTYSESRMKLISLLKREPVYKLLRALAGTEGLSNVGLSTACGLPDSDVSRLLKELTAKGITIRGAEPGKKPVYRIAPDMEGPIADVLRHMDKTDSGSPIVDISPV